MGKVKSYLSLIKFSHTIFAMPFALVGFFLAIASFSYPVISGWNLPFLSEGEFVSSSWKIEFNYWSLILLLTLIILCMIFARSAAMAFNRWIDAKYDAKNPRTAVREIPAGIIKPNYALAFTIISSLLFIICCFFINKMCFYLSPVALLVILGYSYTKRFTALCHLILGLGLSLAPIGAYIAVTGEFALLPVLFSLAVFFWVSGFDIIYALQDEEFDKAQQLHSIPAMLGKPRALRVSELLHVLSAAAIIAAGFYGHFGIIYWIGAAVFIGLLIYQHLLVKPNDLSRVNMAFFTTNGIASIVFAIFVIADLFVNNPALV